MKHLFAAPLLIAMAWTSSAFGAAEPADTPFKAGVATKVITPTEPMWMAGYSNRNKPSDGKVHDLHVKGLALEDPAGGKLVLLTTDLLGLPRELSEAVATEVRKQTGLERDRLMLTVSHTHCGPVIAGGNIDMYDLTPAERKARFADRAALAGSRRRRERRALGHANPANHRRRKALRRHCRGAERKPGG